MTVTISRLYDNYADAQRAVTRLLSGAKLDGVGFWIESTGLRKTARSDGFGLTLVATIDSFL